MGKVKVPHDHSFSAFEGIALWLHVIGLMLYVIAFSTVGWQHYTTSNQVNPRNVWIGLWSACYCDSVQYYENEGWFKAAQAFITMALIVLIIILILSIVYMFVPALEKLKMIIAICVLLFLVVVFILIGDSIFGAFTGRVQFGDGGESYSFILSIIAMALTLSAAIVSIFAAKKVK